MLTPPALSDALLLAALRAAYRLPISSVAFLPLGADPNTAAYRAQADDGKSYFVKLRRGAFDEKSVALPRFLAGQGIAQIIAPLPVRTGRLWSTVADYTHVLYPFVEGDNAYGVPMSEQNWRDLGTALKQLHAVQVPPALASLIRAETCTPRWRESVREHIARADVIAPRDPIAAELIGVLAERRDEILHLVTRAESLAQDLQALRRPFVLCHADMHAGNALIEPDGALHIVDWDDAIFAPKERDLMFPGSGLWDGRRAPEEEEPLFFQGYGPVPIDAAALAYYRYERIVQDIAVQCDVILRSDHADADRAQELRFLRSNFLSCSTIEQARRADPESVPP